MMAWSVPMPPPPPTCDSCGERIREGQRVTLRASYDYGLHEWELDKQWAWHSDCPEPPRSEA